MRAISNTSCDVVAGPGSATPGAILFSGPCRLVEERHEFPLTVPLTDRVAYVTMDSGVPSGPGVTMVGETYTSDYSMSDRIAIPSGNVAVYEVLFTESMIPYGTPAYVRAHVRIVPDLAVLLQETLSPLLQEDSSLLLIT